MAAFRIDVLTELPNAGFTVEWLTDKDWVKVHCPFHNDRNPSCFVNVQEQYFTCKSAACAKGGSIFQLIARKTSRPLFEVVAYYEKKYGRSEQDKPVENSTVEKYHEALFKAPPLLDELYKRGLTDEILRKYRWGATPRNEIAIPIANENGVWVNIKKYTPGRDPKFTNMPGRGQPRIYPIEQLQYDMILLCGGETKAVAAAAELNAYGIGCVCNTAGEGTKGRAWPAHFDAYFHGKKALAICYDIDQAGRSNAVNIAGRLVRFVGFCGIVTLPLDIDKYPKGDISDWIGLERKPLYPLIKSLERFEPPPLPFAQKLAEPKPSDIAAACNPDNALVRLEFRTLVSAIDPEGYLLPKRVAVLCDRQQELCHECPILPLDTAVEVDLSPESEAILTMVNAPAKMQRDAIRKTLTIPPCKSVSFDPQEYYNVKQVALTRDLDDPQSTETDNQLLLASVSVDADLEINQAYRVAGQVMPHPNTQRATAIISKRSALLDSLSQYRVDADKLRQFQTTDDKIEDKLSSILSCLESVTRIRERRGMHQLIDLAYHSCLYFLSEGLQEKGWVEVLIAGDNEQGKTLAASRIQKHFGLGQRVDCRNASVAGLLGGVDKISNTNFISWGIIPANDRRLVILEELSGASPEILAKLTDMRSSGQAEIPKIKRGKANARCRLITLSNSRSGREIASYAYGVDVIRELIPKLEDIRRFDAFTVLSVSEVSQNVGYQNTPSQQLEDLEYKSSDCRDLVLYAWTRKPEQIIFQDWQHLLNQSKSLCELYTDTPPIVARGGQRHRVARLAIALAARLYSTTDDPETILVKPIHVEYIIQLLRSLYDTPIFGYDRYSQAVKWAEQLSNPDAIKAAIYKLNFPRAFVEGILGQERIIPVDFQMWLSCDRDTAVNLMSTLVRNHALERDGTNWRKTRAFIVVLRELLKDKKLEAFKPQAVEEF